MLRMLSHVLNQIPTARYEFYLRYFAERHACSYRRCLRSGHRLRVILHNFIHFVKQFQVFAGSSWHSTGRFLPVTGRSQRFAGRCVQVSGRSQRFAGRCVQVSGRFRRLAGTFRHPHRRSWRLAGTFGHVPRSFRPAVGTSKPIRRSFQLRREVLGVGWEVSSFVLEDPSTR
jgi:hypothetical protein